MDETIIEPGRQARGPLHPLLPSCTACSCTYFSHGTYVSVHSNDPEFVNELFDVVPPLAQKCGVAVADRVFTVRLPGLCACGATHSDVELFDADRPILRCATVDVARIRLRTAIKMHVAEFARGWTFVHAGAVGLNGAGLVIVGPTLSGKTSLVSALLKHGAEYLSDEYAVFDTEGTLYAYPQPLAVREPGQLAQRDQPAAAMGARTATTPLPVRLVAVVTFVEGATWQPRTMSPGEAVLAMLANAPAASSNTMQVMAALRAVAGSAEVVQGSRGEADDTAQQLLAVMQSRA